MAGPCVYLLNMTAMPLTSLTVNGGANLVPAPGLARLSGGVAAAGIAVPQSAAGLPPSVGANVSVQFAGVQAWQQQLDMPATTFADLYLACYENGYILSTAAGKICLYGYF